MTNSQARYSCRALRIFWSFLLSSLLGPWLLVIGHLSSVSSFSADLTNTIAPALIPPKVMREFRGAWVASVGNIDWPSKPGLPTEEQKRELIAILNKASEIGLNAIILQVRPACDALYRSAYEPWSEYLTGKMGQGPNPYYDPLDFAVKEAHERGLELHAWFNPFRAGHPSGKSPLSPKHIGRMHPKFVRVYGTHLWLDPGEPAVIDYSIHVILDVVHRYDIDGVHLDDYFYPYKEKNAKGEPIEFPDDASWRKYKDMGGRLSRPDWRRENVNKFVHRLYTEIKLQKKWVKFGISPFGIWQPGFPAEIKGFNAFDQLYADSRRWLSNGWVDYFSPQLYWSIQPKEQSYPLLLDWWKEQNKQGRLVWPGDSIAKIGNGWHPEEILRQIEISRKSDAPGQIHWNMSTLMRNPEGIAEKLQKNPYREPAIIPAMDWYKPKPMPKPSLRIAKGTNDEPIITWKSREKAGLWLLQTKEGEKWKTEIFPEGVLEKKLPPKARLPDVIAVTAYDRYKLASPVALLAPEREPANSAKQEQVLRSNPSP
jgi:uncharacterized lipoprotein YddW (UPF0748 family)